MFALVSYILLNFVSLNLEGYDQNEREIRHELVLQAARRMMTAARTAPKGKGIDIIEIAMVTDGDILRLSDEMIQIAAETGFKFLLRDAENIKSADAVVIIGTSQKVQGLNCAHCGFDTCVEKPDLVPCAINSVDLGIGSACATAADLRVDTRVMFAPAWRPNDWGCWETVNA